MSDIHFPSSVTQTTLVSWRSWEKEEEESNFYFNVTLSLSFLSFLSAVCVFVWEKNSDAWCEQKVSGSTSSEWMVKNCGVSLLPSSSSSFIVVFLSSRLVLRFAPSSLLSSGNTRGNHTFLLSFPVSQNVSLSFCSFLSLTSQNFPEVQSSQRNDDDDDDHICDFDPIS